MSIVDSFYGEIETGRQGRNWGFSTGLPKLDKLTDGIKKANYTVLFALSGVAKTTIALYSQVA